MNRELNHFVPFFYLTNKKKLFFLKKNIFGIQEVLIVNAIYRPLYRNHSIETKHTIFYSHIFIWFMSHLFWGFKTIVIYLFVFFVVISTRMWRRRSIKYIQNDDFLIFLVTARVILIRWFTTGSKHHNNLMFYDDKQTIFRFWIHWTRNVINNVMMPSVWANWKMHWPLIEIFYRQNQMLKSFCHSVSICIVLKNFSNQIRTIDS